MHARLRLFALSTAAAVLAGPALAAANQPTNAPAPAPAPDSAAPLQVPPSESTEAPAPAPDSAAPLQVPPSESTEALAPESASKPALAPAAVDAARPRPALAQMLIPLKLRGYGELHFTYHNYGPDQTQPGGSPADHRLTFDTTRFVLTLEGELTEHVEFEAEVEFEHGGTGAELELEFEEFGEFETEVEKGGEVLIEELYIEAEPTEWLELKAGRFYVAMGLLSQYYRPTDYLGSARPESETTVLPAVWDEQGISAKAELGPVALTAQVVSGLDSTAFSSQFWVARGHQGRFELIRATGLAFVGRVDVTPLPGLMVGASSYVGDTVDNRPKPDMEGQSALLYLGDIHAAYDRPPVRARATAIWGYLNNAEDISDKNRRLSNNLGVLRTPVAEQALAIWGELGVDIAPHIGLKTSHRLEPMVRVEYYDTMFRTDEGIFDNPRFERTVVSLGVAHTLKSRIVSKLDLGHRRLGSSELRSENTVQISLGFVY